VTQVKLRSVSPKKRKPVTSTEEGQNDDGEELRGRKRRRSSLMSSMTSSCDEPLYSDLSISEANTDSSEVENLGADDSFESKSLYTNIIKQESNADIH
jgi:hypothetical protein